MLSWEHKDKREHEAALQGLCVIVDEMGLTSICMSSSSTLPCSLLSSWPLDHLFPREVMHLEPGVLLLHMES